MYTALLKLMVELDRELICNGGLSELGITVARAAGDPDYRGS